MISNILIVEDDSSAALDLEMMLSKHGVSNIIIAKNINDSRTIFKEQNIHLVLLDIFLGENPSGILLLDTISQLKIPFIICTGFRDREFFDSIKEYKPEAYLIKPIEELSLINEVNKIIFSDAQFNNLEHSNSIIIKQDKRLIKLDYQDIIAVKSEGNYCKVITKSKNYMSRLRISFLEEQLPENVFIKVHRNAIVNASKIISVDFSTQEVFCENDNVISFAKKYSEMIRTSFKR